MATNTNKKIENVSYPFFNEYQAEIQDVIQPALMKIDELARFKPHAEQAAGQREADGREANEEGSFLNLVLCYSENIFLQEVRAFLDSVEIKTAVLMLDGSTGASQAVTVSSVVASLALSAFSGDTHSPRFIHNANRAVLLPFH